MGLRLAGFGQGRPVAGGFRTGSAADEDGEDHGDDGDVRDAMQNLQHRARP
jgi:hypothetical protein